MNRCYFQVTDIKAVTRVATRREVDTRVVKDLKAKKVSREGRKEASVKVVKR